MRLRHAALRALILALFLAGGCDGEGPVDAGPPDDAGGPPPDTGVAMDAGDVDAGPGRDGGDDACAGDGDCGAGEACLRAVCVATCGADLSGWDALLEAGLTPTRNLCLPASVRATRGAMVYDVVQGADGATTTFAIRRWTVDDPTPATVATVRVDEPAGDPWGGATPFLGGYLALSDDASLGPSDGEALFGYTVFAGGNVPGEVLRVDLATGDVVRYDAPGNFGAAWLGADFLVDGLAFGGVDAGQGLYGYDASEARAVHVGSGLGSFSGSVLATSDYVLAGGFESSPILFAVARADVADALSTQTPIDLSAVGAAPVGPSIASSFWDPSEALVATADYMGPLRVWTRTWSGGALTLAGERTIATDSTVFGSVHAVADRRLLLGHADGVLVVTED